MSNETIFTVARNAAIKADEFHGNRTVSQILNHAISEIGETAIEINIAEGASYKEPGPDGIIGEALDAIASLIDLIYKVDPTIREEELVKMLNPKMEKWIEKIKEHNKELK